MAPPKDRRTNPGAGHHEEQPKKLPFACRACGTQRYGGDRCPACGAGAIHEDKLDVDVFTASDGVHIMVQTSRNGQGTNMRFVYLEDGKVPMRFATSNGGTLDILVGWTKFRNRAKLTLIDSRVPSVEVTLPAKSKPFPKFGETSDWREVWNRFFGK